MNFVFRVDASLEIGTGHVMRCLTLAEVLREKGADCRFVCREFPGHLIDRIRQHGFKVQALPHRPDWQASETEPAHAAWLGADWSRDAEETLAALSDETIDWLVVDHYGIDARWEGRLRARVKKTLVIDDLADRPHDCDLLLDQNLVANLEHRYAGRLAEHCGRLLGPEYALLRPQFAAARACLRPRDGHVARLLVFCGGADMAGDTLKVLEAIQLLHRPELMTDVVIGRANPHRAAIEALCASLPAAVLHCQVDDMAALMSTADMFIGAGGTSSWERCCLGLPALVMATADNQIEQIQALARVGVQLDLGRARDLTPQILARAIEGVMNFPAWLKHMGEQGMRLVDGRGAARVADHLLADALLLRRAQATDCDAILAWRNHPETRRYAANPAEIGWAAHRRWFEAALHDSNRELLIAEHDGQPVGVLRYDIQAERAIVSIYCVPGLAGQGWGRRMLLAGERWLRQNRPEVTVCEAEVMAENAASVKLFHGLGFRPYRTTYRKALDAA